ETLVIDSGTYVSETGERTNSAYVNSSKSSSPLREKFVFTPEGEYLPDISRALAVLGGGGAALDRFDLDRNFSQGNDGEALQIGNLRASFLFCLEVMQPGFAASLKASQGANIILVSSSHVWLHASPSLETDTLRFSRAQAVSAGLPLANSASGGKAFVIDRFGRLIKEIGQKGAAEAVVTIPL